jgi:hypothetical protein
LVRVDRSTLAVDAHDHPVVVALKECDVAHHALGDLEG